MPRLFLLATFALLPASLLAGTYLSPSTLAAAPDAKRLYIGAATGQQVLVYDLASDACVASWDLPAAPCAMRVSAAGDLLAVALAGPDGEVWLVDVKTGKAKRKVPARHTPMAPILSDDGKTLYFCNRFDNEVVIADLNSGAQRSIPVQREPIAAALTHDGKQLFVANHLPTSAADQAYVAAHISVIDTAAAKVIADIQLVNGSSSLRDICISPDGKHAYVSHILSRYHLPTTQLERGWVNTNALSIIDVPGRKLINTVLLDDVDQGAANPWGVACSADGTRLCVAHAGTHEVSVIDRQAMHAKIDRAAKGEQVSAAVDSAEDVPNDLSFLVGLRRRLPLAGKAPHEIRVIGDRVYAAEYFSESLSHIALAPGPYAKATKVTLAPDKEMDVVRRGHFLFEDASWCFQRWLSCASCHPDTRTDALNWDLLNDGMGNAKNTKNMLLAHRTPPTTVTGCRPNAETSVRAGIRFAMAVLPEEDAVALDEYLKALTPTPSPLLVKGKLSESAQRGAELFRKARCGKCHSGELYTDLEKHDVGTGKGREVGIAFDVPTLIEAWRTAPYLHDGRARTLEEVLTTFNPDDEHGITQDLSPQQIKDLAAFVGSL
jgi:DNA-binding beta-propeller fold protein YncE/mono/diheme cytochrome c family protein